MANIGILSFNSGEVTPKLDARVDVEKHSSACRHLENFIPLIYGCAERRPGTLYIGSSKTAGAVAILIPFIYSSTIAYKIELGNIYARFIYNDAYPVNEYAAWETSTDYVLGDLVTNSGSYYRCLVAHTSGTFATDLAADYWIESGGATDLAYEIPTPYLTAHLLELHYKQRGDVMWIVHSSYAPRKLTRTSVTVFSLDTIDFSGGPFLTRNDLIDTDVTATATMTSSKKVVGETGTLTFDDGLESLDFFESGHVGALFKLVHPRVAVVESGSKTTYDEGVIGSAIDVKGTFHFNTHGTWNATIVLQRNENGAGWEDYRTYVGDSDRNVQYTGTEEADNVQYQMNVTEHAGGGTITADITVDASMQTGIVKITAINSVTEAAIEVMTSIASKTGDDDAATRRWAEGAWSGKNGYPSSVTFFEERCVYGGMSTIPTQWISS